MFHILGNPAPPKVITEKAFDYVQAPLERLAALVPGDTPKGADLIDYALDLKYVTPLQKELMMYVLPFCLQSWQDALANRASGFTDEFHAALAKRENVIAETAGQKVQVLVRDYMRHGLLNCLARENAIVAPEMGLSPYRWVRHLASYGVIWDDVETLLREWRGMQVEGFAISCLQYLSIFAFRTYENPIFLPWTRERGGGPPVPWEYKSLGFEERWKEKNLSFLRGFLTAQEVRSWAAEAELRLRDHPHSTQARAVVEGISTNLERVDSRLGDLIRFLGTPSEPGSALWEWSDFDA